MKKIWTLSTLCAAIAILASSPSIAGGNKNKDDKVSVPSTPPKERRYKDYTIPGSWQGMLALGMHGSFGEFCGGGFQGGPMGGPCGMPPPCFGGPCGPSMMPHPMPMPMPMPMPGPPACFGITCGGGWHGGFQGGFGGGFNIGEMSADAQLVWAHGHSLSNLATFVEPRYFQTGLPTPVIMDPYYRGPRHTDFAPRPASAQ